MLCLFFSLCVARFEVYVVQTHDDAYPKAWNADFPDSAIIEGDLIVEINGVADLSCISRRAHMNHFFSSSQRAATCQA